MLGYADVYLKKKRENKIYIENSPLKISFFLSGSNNSVYKKI